VSKTQQQPGLPTRRMRVKKLARKFVSILTCYSGLMILWHWLFGRRGVRVLTYHGIEPIATNSYAVSVDNFRKQMEYLRRHCNVVSLTKLEEYLTKKVSLPSNTVLLAFDDGFKDFYQNAYPILQEHQLPAVCFVITAKVGGQDEIRMNWDEVNELAHSGLVTIGSHTVSHHSLARLDEVALRQEIKGSKSDIECKLNLEIKSFSYPYGTPRDFDDRCVAKLAESGYTLSFTSVNGVNWKDTNPFKLRRTKIEWGDDLPTFRKILRGSLDIWIIIDHCLGFIQNKKEVDF